MIKTKLMCLLKTSSQSTFGSTALLLIRLIAGCAFVIHGWGKITHPLDWMGPASPVPAFFQLLAAISEFAGGLFWVIGFLTRISSLGIGATMIVAVFLHGAVMKDPFVNLTGGSSYELALVYLGISILIFAMGPGKISLDAKIFGDK